MQECAALYDRLNLISEMIPALSTGDCSPGDWLGLRGEKEATIMGRAHPRTVFFVVFDPASILMPPSYKVTAYCLLHRVMGKEEAEKPYRVSNLWRYYATESFYEPLAGDFMNRQIHAHFRLRYGQFLFAGGDRKGGLQSVLEAAKIGFDNCGGFTWSPHRF